MPEMQNSVNFIPDSGAAISSTSGGSGADNNEGGLADVAMLIAIIMLATSLAIAAGVFLYLKMLNTKLESDKKSLFAAYNHFDKNTIVKLETLSKSLIAGNDILSKHTAVSEVFKALEKLTLKSVRFTEFKFEDSRKDTVKLRLKGSALTMNAVAAQSKAFTANQDKFQNTIFSDLGFEKDGTISFQVTTDINPDFINFTNILLKNINSGRIEAQNPNAGTGGANMQFSDQTDDIQQGTVENANEDTEPEYDEFGNIIDN